MQKEIGRNFGKDGQKKNKNTKDTKGRKNSGVFPERKRKKGKSDNNGNNTLLIA